MHFRSYISTQSLFVSVRKHILTIRLTEVNYSVPQGLLATIVLMNGERYSGIFSSMSDSRYIIKMAKKLSSQNKQANGVVDEVIGTGPDRVLSFDIQDVVHLSVDNVRLDKSQSRAQSGISDLNTP